MRKLLISTLPGLTLALVGGLAGFAPHSAAAQSAPTFVLSPQNQTVNLSAGTVTIEVQVQNVSDMAAFEFKLRYDAGVLSNPTVQQGAFLPGAQCPDAIVDNQGVSDANGQPVPDPGTVRFGCGTLGQGGGVAGSGTIATVTFHLAGGDHTAVKFDRANLVGSGTAAAVICDPCAFQNGSITVSGGDASKDKGIGTAPPVVAPPTDNNPPIGGVPVASNPGGAADGSSGGTATGSGSASGGGQQATGGTGAGGPTGTIARPGTTSRGTTNGATSGAGAKGAEVGKFGYGPQTQHDHDGRNAMIGALAMAAAGAALLAGGERRRRQAIARHDG